MCGGFFSKNIDVFRDYLGNNKDRDKTRKMNVYHSNLILNNNI